MNAVVTAVLMNRERKEERWTIPSWMGKPTRPDLHLAKTSMALLIGV